MTRHRVLFVAVAVLILAMLACEGSGGRTVTRRSVGNSGHIEISIGSADGTSTDTVEIDEDFFVTSVALEVAVEVASGTCRVELLDDDGSVVFALDAAAGQPASGSGVVTTDMDGEIGYKITAQDAEGIKITIDYERQ